MKTFIVRLFVAEDLPDVHGTVERPGDPPAPFHGARDLLARLGVRGRRRGMAGDDPGAQEGQGPADEAPGEQNGS